LPTSSVSSGNHIVYYGLEQIASKKLKNIEKTAIRSKKPPYHCSSPNTLSVSFHLMSSSNQLIYKNLEAERPCDSPIVILLLPVYSFDADEAAK